MPDDIITRDSNGNIAVNTVSGVEANVPYNYDDCFTLDTNNRRALRTVTDGKALAGNFINVSKTMPTAGASVLGQVHIYTGATNSSFTRGYIYECVAETAYTGTVSFEAATISGITVTCSGDDFAAYVGKWRPQVAEDIESGTLTYDQEGNLWVFDGKNADDENIAHFQLYQEDYEDAGFTFSDTPSDGDVVAFTCTIEEGTANYSWERLRP